MHLRSELKRKLSAVVRFSPIREVVTRLGKVKRRAPAVTPRPVGITLGRYLRGNRSGPLWIGRDGWTVLSLEHLKRHVVILGSGPHEVKLLGSVIMDAAKGDRGAQMLVFDSCGDPRMKALFGLAIVESRYRSPLLFPDQPFNMWDGEGCRLMSERLLQVASSQGDGSFYASRTRLILYLACCLNDEPPRSCQELLERLKYRTLLEAHGEERLNGIDEEAVAGVRLRCQAFFLDIEGALDGQASFADLDAAYFSLDGLSSGNETVERVLRSQLLHYIQHEKDPEQPCVVVLRVPRWGDDVTVLLEIARTHNVTVVLVIHALAEIGSATQCARALQAGTVIADHRVLCREFKDIVCATRGLDPTTTDGVEPDPRMYVHAKGTGKRDPLDMPDGTVWVFADGAPTLIGLPCSSAEFIALRVNPPGARSGS